MRKSDTERAAPVASPALPGPLAFPDGLLRPLAFIGALDVLEGYCKASQWERERIYNFVQDATRRQIEPQEEAAFAALEMFWLFVGSPRSRETEAEICQWHDLTPGQYDRYERAWQSIQSVHEEVRAACLAKYGPEPEKGAAPK